MRVARFLITVLVVSWAPGTFLGQSMRQDETAASQNLFQASLAPESRYGEFRRDLLMHAFARPIDMDPTMWAPADGGQQKPKKPQPQSAPVERPPIDPSMVGYIDNAVIHTRIRVRFDAGLHDYTPDRAEFFYAKCGCYRNPALPVGVYDPFSPGPGPGIPTSVNFQQLYIYGEYGMGRDRYSLFGQLPFRWLQPQSTGGGPAAFPNNGGVGDIQVGARFAPFTSETHTFTFQFSSHVPSGDPAKGLGTNHATIEPMALYYQSIGERAAVEAQFGDTHPLSSSRGVPTVGGGGFAGDVLTWGVGGSYQFVQQPKARVAGVLEFVGWNIFGGMVTPPASTDGVHIVNAKVGPRVNWGEHHSFYFGYGIAMTHATWYHEIFRTEYRYTF
jgi:hypothetical protein